jgi:hypothetical protein
VFSSNDELHYLVEDLAKCDKRLIGAHRSEEMWQASGALAMASDILRYVWPQRFAGSYYRLHSVSADG